MTKEELFRRAMSVTEQSYSPYSHIRVGAALLLDDGSVVTGANIENRSFGLTNCAERSAIFAALSSGKKGFAALAIACPDVDYPLPPCGACRQVISEFTNSDFPIYYGASENTITESTIGELLPADSLKDLRDR